MDDLDDFDIWGCRYRRKGGKIERERDWKFTEHLFDLNKYQNQNFLKIKCSILLAALEGDYSDYSFQFYYIGFDTFGRTSIEFSEDKRKIYCTL